MQHKNRGFRVNASSDREGLVSQAGTMFLTEVADRSGLIAALSAGFAGVRERRSVHDPGWGGQGSRGDARGGR